MKNTLKRAISLFLCLALMCVFASCGQKASEETQYKNFSVDKAKYKLEQVLVLSRHNIRSPLSTTGSLLSEVTNHEWFDWSSNASELSVRGGNLETDMGQYFRKYLVDQGLMEENWVPDDGKVRVYSNSMQRTIATANYFSVGLFPVANIDVEYHEEIGTMDPVFFPRLTFISDKYVQAVEKQKNELIDFNVLKDDYEILKNILDYDESENAKKMPKFEIADAKYILKLNEEPNMEGSLKVANTASDALKLQYFEESDAKKAAFGDDITLKDWQNIGEISDVYSQMLFGLPLLSTNVANPLLKEMKSELFKDGRVFTFLCGHDSNIESVLSALNVKEYNLPGVLEKKTPIGGKLVIEKWRNISDNKEYISVSFIYQTLEQLRERPLLDLENPPVKYRLEFNGISANGDGLYSLNDVSKRFETSINAYDEMVKAYS